MPCARSEGLPQSQQKQSCGFSEQLYKIDSKIDNFCCCWWCGGGGGGFFFSPIPLGIFALFCRSCSLLVVNQIQDMKKGSSPPPHHDACLAFFPRLYTRVDVVPTHATMGSRSTVTYSSSWCHSRQKKISIFLGLLDAQFEPNPACWGAVCAGADWSLSTLAPTSTATSQKKGKQTENSARIHFHRGQ